MSKGLAREGSTSKRGKQKKRKKSIDASGKLLFYRMQASDSASQYKPKTKV